MPCPERFGSYLVYELLGRGGMATVHRAERVEKDGSRTQIALKRLRADVAANRELVEAFATEAHLLRYLDHSNIAQTFDHGKVVGGSYFIAMEYVPGPTLEQVLARCPPQSGTIPVEIALEIAAQICDALDHAHTRCDEHDRPLSIVHRDVCPANAILSNAGFVKLIDFGLAKAKVRRSRKVDTAKGVIKGKFNYVAPEYLDGGNIDARVDVWAVGVMLYELLTSRRLFDAPYDFETVTRVRKLPIPRPSLANFSVTPQLDEIVMRALQRDPRRRWPSAALMREALRDELVRTGMQVVHHDLAVWASSVFARDSAAALMPAPRQRRVTQNTPTVAFPVVERPPTLVDTIARGARRLLRRQSK